VPLLPLLFFFRHCALSLFFIMVAAADSCQAIFTRCHYIIFDVFAIAPPLFYGLMLRFLLI